MNWFHQTGARRSPGGVARRSQEAKGEGAKSRRSGKICHDRHFLEPLDNKPDGRLTYCMRQSEFSFAQGSEIAFEKASSIIEHEVERMLIP